VNTETYGKQHNKRLGPPWKGGLCQKGVLARRTGPQREQGKQKISVAAGGETRSGDLHIIGCGGSYGNAGEKRCRLYGFELMFSNHMGDFE